ncbi:MAG: response regulator [Pseudomonadota bacterium]|nr:response regulator [Pseudomonadota bacterium]
MMPPRLLLIDDEPQLAEFVAKAADMCGYEPHIADGDDDYRARFLAERPAVTVLDLGMPGSDGVELLRFLADQGFAGPVLIISGFDRRVLESAFHLGEALGLNMAGPLEKPTRLERLEAILNELRPTPAE